MRLVCRRPHRQLLAILFALASVPAATTAAAAQAPADTVKPAAPLSFEVVSIKPDKSGTMMMRVMFTPNGISIINIPVHMLLREAFAVSDNQLAAEPGWLNSDHFDIEAKVAAEDVPKLKALEPAERWAMLLPVFQDRFALKVHHESRDLTQYVLVIAKSGPKMKEATPGDTYANGLKAPDGKSSGAGFVRMGPGDFTGQAATLDNLVRFLSFQFHSPVIDKTGLTGKYDMHMTWAPDEMEAGMAHPPGEGQPEPPPAAAAGPSIFTALEEQLGLKLEARKEPGDVIVIDHIEQPSPN